MYHPQHRPNRSEAIGAPGMVVVQFAWGGGPGNVHLPHNHYENCFVYPGAWMLRGRAEWGAGGSPDRAMGAWRPAPRTARAVCADASGVCRSTELCLHPVLRVSSSAGWATSRMVVVGSSEPTLSTLHPVPGTLSPPSSSALPAPYSPLLPPA